LPTLDQRLIAITNEGSKHVTIDWNTTAHFSDSMALYNLVVDAPTGSVNRLRLMYAGTNVPVTAWELTLGANGSLVSYRSALDAARFNVNSLALFADRSFLHGGDISVAGNLMLVNSSAFAGLISVSSNGVVNHFSGACKADLVVLDAGSSFRLDGGTLSIQNLHLEYNGFPVQVRSGLGRFVQAGGQTTLDTMRVGTIVVINGRHGECWLEGGSLTCSNMDFYNGGLTQSDGTASAELISLPAWQDCEAGYGLSGGTLVSGRLSAGRPQTWSHPPSNGRFSQMGGVHKNGSISLSGQTEYHRRFGFDGTTPLGFYSLSGGLLVSSNVAIGGGSFYQADGIGRIQELSIGNGGSFTLDGGELVTSNTSLSSGVCGINYYGPQCSATTFRHEGGTHVVENLGIDGVARYEFQGGRLVAENILIGGNSQLNCETGAVRNGKKFSIAGGVFRGGNRSHRLGRLELVEFARSWPLPPADASSVYVGEGVIRFHDSRDVAWSGARLKIQNWAGGSGRIFVGRDSHGLTDEQLSKIVFVNPGGWPGGKYPAQLLSTGELVPAVPPPVSVARGADGLVLSWPGEYDLLSATNVTGPYLKVPGATSPLSVLFSAPQQYFRLGLTER